MLVASQRDNGYVSTTKSLYFRSHAVPSCILSRQKNPLIATSNYHWRITEEWTPEPFISDCILSGSQRRFLHSPSIEHQYERLLALLNVSSSWKQSVNLWISLALCGSLCGMFWLFLRSALSPSHCWPGGLLEPTARALCLRYFIVSAFWTCQMHALDLLVALCLKSSTRTLKLLSCFVLVFHFSVLASVYFCHV